MYEYSKSVMPLSGAPVVESTTTRVKSPVLGCPEFPTDVIERTVPSFIRNMTPVTEAVMDFTSAGTNSGGVDTLWKSMLLVAIPIFILPQTYRPSVVSKKN